MGIQDQTAAAIAANRPGYAQMTRADPNGIISWHGHGFSETRVSGWDRRDARCALIDAWAQGKARVTSGTFSENQILHRAEQWQHGSGRHIARGQKDPALAKQIRRLAERAECRVRPSSRASSHIRSRADRCDWVLWVSGHASGGSQ